MKFTNQQWQEFSKEDFDMLIRRWCEKYEYYEYVEVGRKIYNRLPYKRVDNETIEVEDTFMSLVNIHRVKSVF